MIFNVYCDDCKTDTEVTIQPDETITFSGNEIILTSWHYGLKILEVDCKCSKKLKDEKIKKYTDIYAISTKLKDKEIKNEPVPSEV